MMQKFDRLKEVFEHQVFELCGPFEGEQGEDYYVPYMMNDALEDYLVLKNCRMVGSYVRDQELEQEMQIAEDENGYVLAVRQGNENAFTLYFQEIEERLQCYQYHEIGHFWVDGQEQWRQLVYMIGTIYDKYQYLGEEVCNDEEMELLPLIEFGPFRDWSPIHESLDEYYPETIEGILLMKEFAKQAGDREYENWIFLYERTPYKWIRKRLQKMLLLPKREELYHLIWSKVEAASSQYAKRVYDEETSAEMQKIRDKVQQDLSEQGYEGSYPEYQKGNQKIWVTEEHPFTIMEWDHYKFKIQFMVSECEPAIEHRRNSGFFEGRGRRGWIEKYEKETCPGDH